MPIIGYSLPAANFSLPVVYISSTFDFVGFGIIL